MDLPTYTNIWRIEKRLYKLYDFRLPMPLPINWIAVFAGITVPYIVLLVAIGLPFNHTLVWLYVLPPGLITWLTTRPVIENKRLPELLESQVRYLAEPRVWCRLAPLSEKDQMVVTARVWHSRRPPQLRKTAGSRAAVGAVALREESALARRRRGAAVPVLGDPAEGNAPLATASALAAGPAASASRPRVRVRGTGPQFPPPGSSGGQRPPGRKPRPSQQDWAAQQHEAARQARFPEETWPAEQPPHGQPARRESQPAKPARFRLAALRPKPAGDAPALPPGVALRSLAPPRRPGLGGLAPSGQEGSLRPWPEEPARPGQPGPPREKAATRSAPPLGSVMAPVPSDLPAHATPDVYPAAPYPADLDAYPASPSPATPGVDPGTPPSAAQVADDASPASSAPAIPAADPGTPSSADVDVESAAAEIGPGAEPPAADVGPAAAAPAAFQADPAPQAPSTVGETPVSAPGPGDGRPTWGPAPSVGAPHVEISHDGSAQRPIPAAAPWPVPGRPLRPAPEAPEVSPEPEPAGLSLFSADLTTENRDKPEVAEDAEASPEEAPPQVPLVTAVADAVPSAVPSIERALGGPSRDRNMSWNGKVKIVTGTGQGPGKRDQEALDRARARLPLKTPQRVLMLGCTSGAGQTVTTLMTGHILASLREEPVAAVDLHDGTLARYSAPAAWLEDVLSGKPPQGARKARPDGLHPTPKAVPARLDVIASREQLRDGDELKLAVQLNRHYPLAMLDPGAAGLMKLLKITDQLVIVVPASIDGAGALADTRDWLDTHGFAELAGQSVTVINGVSRRSFADVEHAESVARGRCRAIVRVPWDDMLPVEVADPSALRPQTRVAYTALAGVLVAGMAAAPVRTSQ